MDARADSRSRSGGFWLSGTGLLLASALGSGLLAWWLIALPVATLSNLAEHSGHFWWTFIHMLGGTAMLFLGAGNLYLGAVKRTGLLHRRLGKAYLLFGAVGAVIAAGLTLSVHKGANTPVLSNISISLTLLSIGWLGCAALGWRAVRNRRFQSHRDWMIRSYVLVWSFVFCRLASRVPGVEDLGGGQAFIWLSWVGPLVVCEAALQWRAGASNSFKSKTA